MNIEMLELGPITANCWILWKEPAGAIVVDPGSDAEAIAEFLKRRKLVPALYLLTHGHMDHMSALADMLKLLPAPVAVHEAELDWMFGPWNEMPPFYPVPGKPAGIERLLRGGEQCLDAGLDYRVQHTPGHTPGGVCFHFPEEKALFTGDTLFAGSVGRTDFPMSDPRAMARSLKTLSELPDDTAIYPGHGPASLMGREKKTNYFMRRG